MGKLLKDNGGFALILTILVVSLIVVLTLQFNFFIRSDLCSATNLRDGISLACIARSGFNFALALLTEDASDNSFDSLNEPWAYSKALSPHSASMFNEGQFQLEIIDLSGKIQINRLVDEKGDFNEGQRAILGRLFNSAAFELDPDKVENLLDAIKDWIDPDNEVTRFGAEDAYYQGLERPYHCMNKPFQFLEQLLLVRGMTKELFYGTRERPGVSRYLSVHGDGKINLNTAEPLVLKSLSPDIDEDAVERMVEYRQNTENDLGDPRWYKNVPGISHVNIDPGIVTTASTYFEIRSEAMKGEMKKILTAMVKRSEGAVTILSWTIQ